MRTWTQAELDELISCPKQVKDAPRKDMLLDGAHQRNDMTLTSVDGEHRFLVFMRVNDRFQENFSVGLDYDPRDEPGNIPLLRCNGPHGEHDASPIDDPHPHCGNHIHRARADLLNAGSVDLKSAELTGAYASFPEALRHFLELVNLLDRETYFPAAVQLPLLPPEET